MRHLLLSTFWRGSSRAHPSFVLQDDIAKYVSDPTPPPQLEDIQEEGKREVKERHEVGEGDDIVTIEDTSDEEDGETPQERFQLRSRFSRPGLPHIPLLMTGQQAWKLVSLRHRKSHAI
jgi:hypothetical protein